MRTTTMGCTTWAGGVTPGIRRPVRTITEPADALAQDAVGASDIAGDLGRHRGCLQAEAGLPHRGRGLADHLVRRRPAVPQGEVVVPQLELEPQDRRAT